MVKISNTNNKEWVKQASILSQALPFMQRYTGKNITIKYGGAAMGDGPLSASFAKDIALLKQVGINPVVVHGGGPRIKVMLDRLKVKSSFVDGLRITDKETMKIHCKIGEGLEGCPPGEGAQYPEKTSSRKR